VPNMAPCNGGDTCCMGGVCQGSQCCFPDGHGCQHDHDCCSGTCGGSGNCHS
jgi:hypothetical protein